MRKETEREAEKALTNGREKNILLRIQYDGTDFHGWQKQPEVRTVQGEIESVLFYLAGEDVVIHGTSRTDRGVHALGQCASFRWANALPTENLALILNRRFGAGGLGRHGAPGDIRILEAREMPPEFHARFSCRGKTYRYVIDRSGDLFRRHHAFLYGEKLDHDVMRRAAEYLVGTHDFKAFEASGGIPRETTVRTIYALTVEEEENRTVLRVTGDGFLYNMVRIIAGTLIEAGCGKRSAESVGEAVRSLRRASSGFTAPPQGLYLDRIYFDEGEGWHEE